jgi:hypothetical protein
MAVIAVPAIMKGTSALRSELEDMTASLVSGRRSAQGIAIDSGISLTEFVE